MIEQPTRGTAQRPAAACTALRCYVLTKRNFKSMCWAWVHGVARGPHLQGAVTPQMNTCPDLPSTQAGSDRAAMNSSVKAMARMVDHLRWWGGRTAG